MAFTAVGAIVQGDPAATTTQTFTVSPVTAGDLMVFFETTPSSTITVTGVSGGGADAGGWTQIQPGGSLNGTERVQMFWARVGTTGTNLTVTVTFSASATGLFPQFDLQMFTAGTGSATPWSVDTSGITSGTSATPGFPTLTASSAGELYVGYVGVANSATAGSTTGGWVWQTDVYTDELVYNLSVGSGSVTPPNATQTSGTWSSIGALFRTTSAVTASATLTGAGSLTATPLLIRPVTATMAGAGSLTASPATAASTTLGGVGSLATTPTLIRPVTTALAGAGQLTATAIGGSAATLAGAGALAVTPTVMQLATVALSGAGSLTAAPTNFQTATLAGAGSITSQAVVAVQVSLVGVGGFAAAPLLIQPATALLAGAGSLTSLATLTTFPTAVLAGAGSFTASTPGSAYMPYVPEGWTDNSLATPLSAARMTYMETGMVAIDTAQQGKAPLFVPTVVKTSAYSAAGNDLVPVDLSAGSVAITLPSAPSDKTQIAVQVVTVGASNTCTILTGGSDVFDKTGGATTKTLSLLGEYAVFEYKSSGAIWYLIASGAPRASLDSRYLASPTFTGTVTIGGRLVNPSTALTYAATVTTDVSTDDYFRITLTGPLTLANPINPADGQKVTWELVQDATGSRALTLGAAFNLGAFTSTLTTTANKRDFLTAIYNSTAATWYVVQFAKGY